MSLHVQFLTLSLMAGSGAVLGVGYDIIEVLTREFRLRRIATALMDITYWLAATFFVFQVLVYANNGQVRMFVFIGLLVGVMIYTYILSNLIQHIVTWVITFLVRVLKWWMHVLYQVIVKPLLYIIKALRIVIRFLQSVSMFLWQNMLQCIRYVMTWIMRWF